MKEIWQIVFLIVFGIFLLLLIMLILDLIIYNKNKTKVLNNSERIKKLMELNNTIIFFSIDSKYSNCHSCRSKRQLENFSIKDYMISLIISNEEFYVGLLKKIASNRKKYAEYLEKVRSIKTTCTEESCKKIKLSLKKFLKYEKELFEKNILTPKIDTIIYCEAYYTSPKGRNYYNIYREYNIDELALLYKKAMELKQQRQEHQDQVKTERSKMTESLRYDILKRDNFRCQICGHSAQDGVRLHVDHIIPVSKGGKTTPSNLRTLCERCNLGKSNKI